jgi:signal peptidase I
VSSSEVAEEELGLRFWMLLLGAGVLLAFLTWNYLLTLTTMTSNSMKPTLLVEREGGADWILVDRLTPRFRDPQRGEIVHFLSQGGPLVLKRVVGLPGETLEIRDGKIWIDGVPLKEPPEVIQREYVNGGHLEAGARLKIKAGNFLLLGDDSQDSYDSRFWGCLPRSGIRGLARAIVWPPGRVRGLGLGEGPP